MLTSIINNYGSIEFNTKKKIHKVVLYYIVRFWAGFFLHLGDLYRKIVTSRQAIFIIVTFFYHYWTFSSK